MFVGARALSTGNLRFPGDRLGDSCLGEDLVGGSMMGGISFQIHSSKIFDNSQT